MGNKRITLPCRRCNNTEKDQNQPGLCVDCGTVVDPDPARERNVAVRIEQMKTIHALEVEMTCWQRQEWINAGQAIVSHAIGLGGK